MSAFFASVRTMPRDGRSASTAGTGRCASAGASPGPTAPPPCTPWSRRATASGWRRCGRSATSSTAARSRSSSSRSKSARLPIYAVTPPSRIPLAKTTLFTDLLAARLKRAACRPSASGRASRRSSRRSRAWSCGRASRPRRISPAAGRAGTWSRPGRRRAPA